MTRVVIAGVSTRAAAASAARAGFAVIAIDGYADRDQHAGVRAIAVPRDSGRDFTAAAAAALAAGIECDAVAYLSNFENNPEAVAALARGRTLWGNPPDVVRSARDPFAIAAMFRSHGWPTPLLLSESDRAHASDDPKDWVMKPLSSGGGHGIRTWRPDDAIRAGYYVQERIAGTPGSVVFVAAGGRASILAVSRQLIGDARFGGRGFRYCGSILAPMSDAQFTDGEALWNSARGLADVASADLGLAGVNGIDFVARARTAYPIEINPRWSASVELIERAGADTAFAAHAEACATGSLPTPSADPRRAFGKAIVFARGAVTVGSTDGWLDDPDVADVPHTGESIGEGEPVCTVFASATTAVECEAELVQRAERIYTDLGRWERNSSSIFKNQDSRIKNQE